MRRPILRYGAPVLQQTAAPVALLTPAVDALIDDMRDTLHHASGVGLAAPQVGESVRVCLIDLTGGKRPDQAMVLINPDVIERDGLQLKEEGCLSVPGIEATVPRPLRLTVRAMDRDGDVREIRAEGLLARVIQHEVDHLNGILFLDRLRPEYRWALTRRISRLRRAGKW